MRRHLVLHPTFKEQKLAGLRLELDVILIFPRTLALARRGGHQASHARVFDFEGTRPLGAFNKVHTADHAQRMEMHGVVRAKAHLIGPACGHVNLAPEQVPFKLLDKLAHVRSQLVRQFAKVWRCVMQVCE